MSRDRRLRPFLPAFVLALAAGLAAQPAAADYRQSYLDGRRALERGEIERAIALLGAAARERPLEQARARLVGAIPEPYLPHHYLGLAHFQAGRCAEAVAEWELSERQGAVQSVAAAYALARRHRAECASLEAAESAQEDDEAAAAPGGPGETEPALETDPAPDTAIEADAPIERGAAVESAPTMEPAGAVEPGAPLEPGAAITPGVDPRDEHGADRAVERAPPPAGGSAAPSAAAAAPLPDDLLAAIQAYLDGDYRRALALLASSGPAPDAASTRRARFLAALFRAASRHALFLLGGARDRALLRAAEADVAECRRAAPGFAPRPDHFSPRFVAFFAGVPAPP